MGNCGVSYLFRFYDNIWQLCFLLALPSVPEVVQYGLSLDEIFFEQVLSLRLATLGRQ